jgi:CBS domain-containing protein
MTDKGSLSLLSAVGKPLYDIFGSIIVGALAGSAIASILRFFFNREIILPLCVGCLLAIIGICDFLDLDLILAAMSSGAMVANLVPRQSNEAFDQLSKFAPPIFVLFFVLVGARLQLKAMEAWIIALAVAYLIGRTGGKFLGAYLGAKWGRMPTKVKKYLGFCLFSQAGVAIGLAILAGHKLPQDTAQSIILVITSTTFLVQIIGPPSVRFAVFKAGEVGKDVTEEDLLASHQVREFMDSNPAAFKNDAYLKQILHVASKSDALYYPVVDEKNKLSGVISFLKIKNLFTEEGLEDLVVAEDLMEKVDSVIVPEAKLAEALSIMRKEELEYLPVVSNLKSQLFIGMIEERKIRKTLHQEIIRKKNPVRKKG